MIYRTTLAIMLMVSVSGLAQADPPWQRGERGERHERRDDDRRDQHEYRNKKDKRKVHDRFIDDDRVRIGDFYRQHPSSLPPGLAKRNGNLPPGLAKRGGNLPPGLSRGQTVSREYHQHLLPLPKDLEKLLPPPPHDVIRRIIGRDIVLIHKTNMKVLDVLKDALPHP